MNILFILTDQQHRDALGCMGNPDVDTPHLDRLAESGILFRRCYSNDPVCGPYRGSLLTGQYTSRCGVIRNGQRLPVGTPTFAEAFNQAGYHTAWVGKWHLGANGNEPIPPDLQGGFQRFFGYQCYNDFYQNIWFYDHFGKRHEKSGHRTEATTNLAMEQVDDIAKAQKPFLLMVSYQAPHYPVQPAAEYAAMYKGREIHHRPNCQRETDPYTPTNSPPSPRPFEQDPTYKSYGGNLDEYIRLYNAMCTQIDTNVGRLLEHLQQLGLAEDTAIIFTSDHGDMQGSHGRTNKCLPYEESAGVPLIIHLPGTGGGRVTDHLVSGIDFMPTCIELAGIDPVPGVDGKSIAGFLNAEADTTRDAVFSERGDAWCMIVQDGWKLAAHRQEEGLVPMLMTHLDKDPYELRNRSQDPEVAELRHRLLAKLHAWDQDVRSGDTGSASQIASERML